MRNDSAKIALTVAVCILIHCSNNGSKLLSFYEPSVYFAGYIGNTYDSLTGNSLFQNSCKLVNDTIRMNFFSESFSEENKIRDGDFIRIDIYPGSDSAIGRSNVLFHMARYHGGNASYNISPGDTKDKIQFTVNKIERKIGGKIDLEDITVISQVMPGTSGEELRITEGIIQGTIK